MDSIERTSLWDTPKDYRNPISQFLDENIKPAIDRAGKVIRGGLNTAFPQASLVLGGQEEFNRRGMIADKYPDSSLSSLPNASEPSDFSAQQQARLYPGKAESSPPIPMQPPTQTQPDNDAQLPWEFSPQRADDLQKRFMQGRGFSALDQPGIAPSEAPSKGIYYQEQDGKTRYEIPGLSQADGKGRGYAEFQGKRQGNGTFSVLGSRTPEEQAAIDAAVAGIDKQTAALHSLKNAERQAKGLPTIEQEQNQAAMQSWLAQVAPEVDTRGMTPEQKATVEMQQNQQRSALSQNWLAQQAAQAKTNAENQWEQLKFRAERGDKQAEQQLNREKNYLEARDRGYGRTQKDQEIALAQAQYLNPKVDPIQKQKVITGIVEKYRVVPKKPGELGQIDEKSLANDFQIPTLKEGMTPQPGEAFFVEETQDGQGGFYLMTENNGPARLSVMGAAEWALQPRMRN